MWVILIDGHFKRGICKLNGHFGKVDMQLHKKEYQWIYDKCNEMQRALVTMDWCKQNGYGYSNEVCRKAEERVHHLALSFLLVAMGENIPKALWTVSDYSELYGLLDDNRDDLNLIDD